MIHEFTKISHRLNSNEMKRIRGGEDKYCENGKCPCKIGASCKYKASGQGTVYGKCSQNSNGDCVCAANDGLTSVVSNQCRA